MSGFFGTQCIIGRYPILIPERHHYKLQSRLQTIGNRQHCQLVIRDALMRSTRRRRRYHGDNSSATVVPCVWARPLTCQAHSGAATQTDAFAARQDY